MKKLTTPKGTTKAKAVNKALKQDLTDAYIPDYDHLFNEKSEKSSKKSGFFKKILKANIKGFIGTMLLYVPQHLPVWILPVLTANIITIVTEMPMDAMTQILINVAILVVCVVENVPATVSRSRVRDKMLRGISAGIKGALFRKLQRLSITYHKEMESGVIQAKFLKDLTVIDSLLAQIIGLLESVLGTCIAVAITLFRYSNGYFVALFFIVIIPLNILLTKLFMKRMYKNNRTLRKETEHLSAKVTDMLEMLPVTKAHGLEEHELEVLDDEISKQKKAGLRADRTVAYFGSCMFVISTLLNSSCLVFCAILAVNGFMSVSEVVLYQALFIQVNSYITAIVNLVPAISVGVDSVRSVGEIMSADDIERNKGKEKLPAVNGELVFENLYYRYPKAEDYVIKNMNLHVKQGECIAFVGSSGSGKTTVMNLIIGFMLPTEGKLLVDGNDINGLDLCEYRHFISVVPQNSLLFTGTIRENITYGLKYYSEEDLQRVVKLANIEEFLPQLSNGLETNVGEHGSKLSGGQRQRITIARALLRNPRILILDEATSALDNVSEYHVQKAMAELIKGRTTFIVAHRLSTIRDADRIVVMDKGECVEIGTYQELMAKKGRFYELKTLSDISVKESDLSQTADNGGAIDALQN